MRVVAFIGPSRSGKTTLICALIRHFVAQGQSVAAIKHTHHRLNEERRGDTGRFEAAGASPVVLAADCEGVLFDRDIRRITFHSPADILGSIDADLVLVEGFKSFEGWPRITPAEVSSVEEAVALLDRIP